MTSNQINYAQHLENQRHNKEMERQGRQDVESNVTYRDRSGRANLMSAEGAYLRGAAARDTVPINWYTATTNQQQKDEDQLQNETIIQNEERQRQWNRMQDLWNRNIRTQMLDIENQNAITNRNNAITNARNASINRTNMWFSAAGVLQNNVNTIGNIARVFGGARR